MAQWTLFATVYVAVLDAVCLKSCVLLNFSCRVLIGAECNMDIRYGY